MEQTLKVKAEPIDQEEVEEILPCVPEPVVHVKSECSEAKPECNTNCSKHQENSRIQIKNPSVPLNKTLININGVFYFLERIPETLVQNPQTKNIVPQVNKKVLDESAPTPCPNCGKILKQHRNLKIHMQTCYYRSNYDCSTYQTMSGHYLLLDNKKCGEMQPKPIKIQRNGVKVNFLCVCLACNTSTPLYSKTCRKCGSMNHWKCKICNATFSTWNRARYHLRTKCKSESYYYCLICDYRNVAKYFAERHIVKTHPESKPISNFFERRKVSTGVNGAEHVCSLCNKKFEDASGLNRHIYICKKYQLYSRGSFEKIKTNEDVSQTKSSSKSEHKSYRQFIIRHCETCNKEFELEDVGASVKKSCIDCLSTLIYKCKKCGGLYLLYDSLVKHVKAVCNQEEQFKCVQCDFVTFSMSRLTEHNKRLHGDISATCTNCGLYFTNSTYFKNHIKRCGFLATSLQCDICPYKTSTKTSLRKHMTSNHNTAAVSVCRFSEIRTHIQPYCTNCCRHQTTNHRLKFCKLCKSKLQFNCLTCNKMHPLEDPDVCEHIKNYLDLLSFESKCCGKVCFNMDQYKLYDNYCGETKTKRFNRFPNKTDSKPIEMKIAKVLHLCHYCSYETRTKANLKKHVKIHLETNSLSSLAHKKFDKETSHYKFDGDSKLNLQCKIVVTRLDIKSV